MKELLAIQTQLSAPKGQFNKFGNYKYRSCEDILEALKPLLAEHEATLIISDELVMIGDRYYVKATATLRHETESVIVNGFAREEENKKGMDGSQVTGACSSYARKYALNGLFLIDDNKDSDSTNEHGNGKKADAPAARKPLPDPKPAAKPEAAKPKEEPKAAKPVTKPAPKPAAKPELPVLVTAPVDPNQGDKTPIPGETMTVIADAFEEVGIKMDQLEQYIDLKEDQWTLNTKAILLSYYTRIADNGDADLLRDIKAHPAQ